MFGHRDLSSIPGSLHVSLRPVVSRDDDQPFLEGMMSIDSDDTKTPEAEPRRALLAAALTGLMSVAAAGCATEEEAQQDDTPRVLSKVTDESMTFAKFSAECEKRGGLVQTHAVCAGNNACKGLSFNKYSYELTEHTCKALNSCGGMSCVVLPADQGRTGEVVYALSCGGCHGEKDKFTLFVPPGTDVVKAKEDFPKRSAELQVAIVAFGIQGMNPNGTAAANMPAHHEKYSVAEIERVVTYVRSLPLEVEAYGIVGVSEDVPPPTP